MVFGIDRHAVVLATSLDGITAYHRVADGIDHRKDILVLQVDIDLTRHRIVLGHARLAAEA